MLCKLTRIHSVFLTISVVVSSASVAHAMGKPRNVAWTQFAWDHDGNCRLVEATKNDQGGYDMHYGKVVDRSNCTGPALSEEEENARIVENMKMFPH